MAVVSREYGLDHMEVFSKSITKINFKLFLEGLRRNYPFHDIPLIMNNLSLHKNQDTKALMEELGFIYIYAPVHAPEYNGIEEVFSMANQIIKKKWQDNMLGNDQEDFLMSVLGQLALIYPGVIAS